MRSKVQSPLLISIVAVLVLPVRPNRHFVDIEEKGVCGSLTLTGEKQSVIANTIISCNCKWIFMLRPGKRRKKREER